MKRQNEEEKVEIFVNRASKNPDEWKAVLPQPGSNPRVDMNNMQNFSFDQLRKNIIRVESKREEYNTTGCPIFK